MELAKTMTSTHKKQILAVDDESLIRTLLSDILSHADYKVDLASNGEEALQKLEESTYDLVITDISMPVMDGMELYSKIIKKVPELKNNVLFITGNLDSKVLNFLNENSCKYILKPFNISELLKEVNNTLKDETRPVKPPMHVASKIEPEVKKQPSVIREHKKIAQKTRLTPKVKGVLKEIHCPACSQTFNVDTSNLENHISCLYCGCLFGMEKLNMRTERRTNRKGYCLIFGDRASKKTPFVAKTEDMSQNGMMIRFSGKPLIPGNSISVYINGLTLHRTVQVKWSKAESPMACLAGLKFTKPIRVPERQNKRQTQYF